MDDKNTLTDLLLAEMSRRNTDLVADLVLQKPELFEDLFLLFSSDTEPVSRRAAWVIDTVSEKNPGLIRHHLDEMIKLLPTFSHDGLKRHSLRILARSPLPSEGHLGALIKISFDWLLSMNEAIAVKVYCMEILYRVSLIEPDLKRELADSIEWRMNEESAGFKSKGKKILKMLLIKHKKP
ncbi:MAG: hypothetical protein NTW16_14030 [Bacteroidetes bacterium]|nr:hypothetical protein [Bacteroidota bacterium]